MNVTLTINFLLEINPPDCFIRDVGSLNGTFIVRPDLTIISPKEAITNDND
ncbi:MAG: hypothetical protein WA140_10790 [Geobacteraceae bacterium]